MHNLAPVSSPTPETDVPDRAGDRPRRSSSVRVRILGWYVVLLGISLIAALFLQRAFLLAQATSDVAEALDQEVGELRQLAGGIDPATGEPFGTDVAAIFDTFLARNVPLEGEALLTYVDGAIYKTDVTGATLAVLPVAGDWGRVSASERGSIEDEELGEIRYLAVPLQGPGAQEGVFVVAVLLENRLAAVEGVVRVGAIVYGSIFLLASALAWVAAGRILRPLTDLTDTAQAISETDLSGRIEVDGDDEIAELGRTFNSMLDRLDEAFAAQRRFVDDAGHELRTPITVIRGNLEVMDEDPDDREATLALVNDELERMSRIVDDLLDLAKAEQPDFIQRAPMDLSDFTRDLASKAAALDDREWVVEASPHAVIDADRHRLNQAMMNLLRNASEHSPAGAPVYLGSRIDDGLVRLWVRDEGEPIGAADRQRIFERFSRAGIGRRRTEGAGLGLAIVAAIAEGHGGDVRLTDAAGGGNVFTISIRPDEATEQ
jgi:two-component system OmpR family sensor kinase